MIQQVLLHSSISVAEGVAAIVVGAVLLPFWRRKRTERRDYIAWRRAQVETWRESNGATEHETVTTTKEHGHIDF